MTGVLLIYGILKVLTKTFFFRTTNRVFRLQNGLFSVYKTTTEWTFLGKANNELFLHDRKNGLLVFKNNVWENIAGAALINLEVTAILPSKSGSSLITTLKNGVFNLTKDKIVVVRKLPSSIFTEEKIFTAIDINNNWIALGTTNKGIYIIDTAGNVIQHFSKTEGLQSDDVHCIFLDIQGNLWAGLDNGIDCIAFNSAVKLIKSKSSGQLRLCC